MDWLSTLSPEGHHQVAQDALAVPEGSELPTYVKELFRACASLPGQSVTHWTMVREIIMWTRSKQEGGKYREMETKEGREFQDKGEKRKRMISLIRIFQCSVNSLLVKYLLIYDLL